MPYSVLTKRAKMPFLHTEAFHRVGTRYGPSICGRNAHEPTTWRGEANKRLRVSRFGIVGVNASRVRAGRGAIRPARGRARRVHEMVRSLPRSRSHPPGHQRADGEIPGSQTRRTARMDRFAARNSQISRTAWDFGDAAVSQDRNQ